MKRGFQIAILGGLASVGALRAAAQTPQASEPKWATSSFDLLVPEDIRATGAHGTVVLESGISSENRMKDTSIARSSKSVEIDEFVLKKFIIFVLSFSEKCTIDFEVN